MNLLESDFSRGWVPSADSINAPPNSLLRADNMVLDEIGALTLRRGSTRVLAISGGGDARSIFTARINGGRYRCVQVGDKVYVNGVEFPALQFDNATSDVRYASWLGWIFMAQGLTKRKFASSTSIERWGISKPPFAPSMSTIPPDSATLASCSNTESPLFVADEGTLAFTEGQNGVANSAIELTLDAATFRGSAVKTFAGSEDFSVYDGGQEGSDDDLFEFYVYTDNPTLVELIEVMVDVNESADTPFQEDYFFYQWGSEQAVDVALDSDQYLADRFDVEGWERKDALLRREPRQPSVSRLRNDSPTTSPGWTKLSIPRGKMQRVGSSPDRGWNTVHAVKVVAKYSATGVVRFDNIRLIGGTQRGYNGSYAARYVLIANNGNYVGRSGPSPVSESIEAHANGLKVHLPDHAISNQVNEIWVYIMGGGLDRYYRAAVVKPPSLPQVVNITKSERDILIENETLEIDNDIPPDNIIGLEGPHYGRVAALTSEGLLYFSRLNNPDSFMYGTAIRVSDKNDTVYWMKRGPDGLVIGTSKDIVLITGDGQEFPDGTMNFRREFLGVGEPPVSDAVCQEGSLLFYMSSEGPRILDGRSTQPVPRQDIDLLLRGYPRHNVQALVKDGRIRMGILDGVFTMLAIERNVSADNDRTNIIWQYNFTQQRWYRHVYPYTFRSLYREPDGRLVAGTTNGEVIQLYDYDHDTDNEQRISCVIWTPHLGDPQFRKDSFDYQIHADMDQDVMSIAFHVDDSATATKTIQAAASPGATVFLADVKDLPPWRIIQQRITGLFYRLRIYRSALAYRPRPPFAAVRDTGYVDTKVPDLCWLRYVKLRALGKGNINVDVYMDGQLKNSSVIRVAADVVTMYRVKMPRAIFGKQPRVQFSLTSFTPDPVPYVPHSPAPLESMSRRIGLEEFSPTGPQGSIKARDRARFSIGEFGMEPFKSLSPTANVHAAEAWPLATVHDAQIVQTEEIGEMVFNISLSHPLITQSAMLSYATRDYSALAGVHYTAVSGIVEIQPGAMEAEIRVPILGKYNGEGLQFYLDISADLNCTCNSPAVGTITSSSVPTASPANLYDRSFELYTAELIFRPTGKFTNKPSLFLDMSTQ